uniref:Calcium homeostasis modulator family member 6 n=1 Tax=Buteo japonicus TaxID=224669 RepID=A0A8C0B205_9AVES
VSSESCCCASAHHFTVLGHSIVSLLTAASEHTFSFVVFKHPGNPGNVLYGSVFLAVPAFILSLCSPWGTCSHRCLVLPSVTARALVDPGFSWITVAGLRASFYKCAASGSSLITNLVCKGKGRECHKLLLKTPCNEKLLEEIPGEFLSLQAQSQLIGWLLIVSIMTVALIVTCVIHCRSPVSYLQLKFWKICSKKERELFGTKAKEHATRLAEINTDCFFEATNPAPCQTSSDEDWQKISFLETLNSQEQYYSMIHKYINTNRGNSIRFREGNQKPPVLGSVDEESASESGF